MQNVIIRFITSLLCVMFASLASAESLHGYIAFSGSEIRFIDAKSQKSYLAKAGTQSVQNSIQKLKNYDFISGNGSLRSDVIVIDSIEFVGLRRLLGVWQAEDAVIKFIDFSTVSIFFPLAQPASSVTAEIETASSHAAFRYALAPSVGNSWRVFFSDENNVILGLLNVDQNQASIELYDPNTGEVGKSILLEKVKTAHGLDLY